MKIAYREGYKYQLVHDYAGPTLVTPPAPISTEFVELGVDGVIWLKGGYAWDGPSGPTFDTPDFMRGSVVHDALYQLMREKLLDTDVYRKAADETLRAICLEDGMENFRAAYVYGAVRLLAAGAADPRNAKPIIFAGS